MNIAVSKSSNNDLVIQQINFINKSQYLSQKKLLFNFYTLVGFLILKDVLLRFSYFKKYIGQSFR